jgi:hypothetical protein
MKKIFTILFVCISTLSFQRICAQNAYIDVSSTNSTDPVLFDDSFNDWILWQSGTTTIRKRDAGSQISNFAIVGSQTVQNFSDAARKISWENGDPIEAGNSNSTGIYVYGEGNGFEFTAPAGTKESTLTLYFSGWAVVGELTASLSDRSASDFVDVTAEYPEDAAFVYTIKYKAASEKQTISIKWIVSKNLDLLYGGFGNVAMSGATYETAANTDEIPITKITLDGGSITTDNGTLQLNAQIEPSNATNKNLKWSIVGGTGLALLSPTGLISAISNGTVKVSALARDGSYTEAKTEVLISGQTVDQNDIFNKLNSIRNWDFATNMEGWDSWADESVPGQLYPEIQDGVCVMKVGLSEVGENWHYQLNQQPLNCEAYIPYTLKFKSWATADNTPCAVDFEDTELNKWNRYGSSSDMESANGTSEWHYTVSKTPAWLTFHVNFDKMVETTVQKINWLLSSSNETIYLDSILLIKDENLTLSNKVISQNNELKVYPNPVGKNSQLTVSLTSVNVKVAIYNALGQKMMEKEAFSNSVKFDISNLHNGLYFVRLMDGTSQKFIVQ